MAIRIEAHVDNALNSHRAVVATNGAARDIAIPPRQLEWDPSANGGELPLPRARDLFTATTCIARPRRAVST
jgi:hypothetical protein